MKREDKQRIVETWHGRFGKAQTVLMTAFQGQNAAQAADLRRRCHEAKLDFVVMKNTLANLALKDTPFATLGESLRGPVGWAVGYADEVEAAKLITKYIEEKNPLKLLGGAIIGQTLSVKEVEALSKLPGRNDMRATFLGLLGAVPSKFVRTLNEVPAGIARVIDAKRASMES